MHSLYPNQVLHSLLQKKSLLAFCLLIITVFFFTCKTPKAPSSNTTTDKSTAVQTFNPNPSPAYLAPEESLKTIQLPEGYHLELVASEPMVTEPVAIAWDGNGRMFVAEMNTYMLDINGTNENEPVSRISLLEDTNKDGKMDKSTVFVDSLLLPRMILPLDDRLLVTETYSNKIWSYRDTTGDGIADEKKLMFNSNAIYEGNLEHQKSGLIWNLDNWIYLSRDQARFRYTNNGLQVDTLRESPSGQWGLTNDNYGRLYFSLAGGEIPALGFQQHPVYGQLDFKDQFNDAFQATWPIIATPDVQGGKNRLRENNTLNHFSASCGQSIFKGNRLPTNMQGDLFICEPVGRLIRRAKITQQNGKVYLKNAYDQQEFLASSDMNFRPVNTATGPDGCLYIVDMYRGIIQESRWTREGSFLRPEILRLGLDKNKGRGRIYRVVHNKMKPDQKKPTLLQGSSKKLLTYLNHPNGWWRENAQKIIVVRGDKSVVPALQAMVKGEKTTVSKLNSNKNKNAHLARLHALWTLEGLNTIDKTTLFWALQDEEPQVRKAAVMIGEAFIKQEDPEVINKLETLKFDPSIDVRIQLALSFRSGKSEKAKAVYQDLYERNRYTEMIVSSQKSLEASLKAAAERKARNDSMSVKDKNLIAKGAATFKQICSACHGEEGKGLAIGGSDMVAPPLAGSARVNGPRENLIKILLHGLTGPIDGKAYPDVMPAMGHNNDEWIAAVISYIRTDLGNKGSVIRTDDVKRIRRENANREQSWTLAELLKIRQ